jgi:hypothetical protein
MSAMESVTTTRRRNHGALLVLELPAVADEHARRQLDPPVTGTAHRRQNRPGLDPERFSL